MSLHVFSTGYLLLQIVFMGQIVLILRINKDPMDETDRPNRRMDFFFYPHFTVILCK